MAATAAKTGFGTTLQYLSTDPSTYSTIGELKSFTPPSSTRETVDATHMASPDGYREFIGTLRDGGEATATFNFTAAGYAILNTIFDQDALETFKATLPGGDNFVYQAIITEKPIDNIEIDGIVMMSATFKISGKPVFTAGA